MPAKPQICYSVAAADVLNKVSGEFRKLVRAARLDNAIYTVVSFPGMRGNSTSIIDSKTLLKALGKCEGPNRIIVVAHDFTIEARAIMEEGKITAIFERDSGWTDERWAYIRDNY